MITMNKEDINEIVDEYIGVIQTGKEKEWRIQPDMALSLLHITARRSVAEAINNLADAIREKK